MEREKREGKEDKDNRSRNRELYNKKRRNKYINRNEIIYIIYIILSN